MSTLKVTDIQSNGTGFNDVVSFKNASGTENGTLCRAWVNFNGTGTVAIRDSFNVSSITDNGTGHYTIHLTNALNDANYAAAAQATWSSASWGLTAWTTGLDWLSNEITVYTGYTYSNYTYEDSAITTVSLFR